MAPRRVVDHTGPLVQRRLVPSARAAVTACVLLAWAATGVALVGNALDRSALNAFAVGAPGTKVLTAIGLVLLGAALWFGRDPGRLRQWLRLVLASGALVLGLVAVVEYTLDRDFGLAGIYDAGAGEAPGAMSPQSALALVLLAVALLTVRRRPKVAQVLAVGATTIALAAVVGIGFGIHTFLGMSGVVAMSLPGAISVASIAIGVIALDTTIGIGRLLTARTSGGRLARRGLAIAVLASVGFGVAVFVAHEHLGLVTSDVAASLYFLGSVVIASGLVLPLGFSLDRVDRARAAAIHDLVTSEALARELIEHAPEAIVVFDVDLGRFVRVNPEAERVFGLPSHELLHRGPVDVSEPIQADGRPAAVGLEERLEEALRGQVPVFEWRFCTPMGRPIEAEVRLLRLPDPTRTLVRGSIVDVGERKRAEAALRVVDFERAARAVAESDRDRSAALQRITARLLAAPSVDDVAAAFVDQIVPDLGASTGIIFTRGESHLERRGHTADAGDPVWDRVRFDAPTTSAEAVRFGRAVVVIGIEQAIGRFPPLAATMDELGYGAFASYPLYAGERLVGVGSFGFGEVPTEEHWDFLERVADRVGQALERAQLFEAERDARHQLEHAAERAAALQRVTQALARASAVDEVIDLTATLGIEALGAQATTTGILDPGASEYAVRTFGFPHANEPRVTRLAEDRALPGPETVRTQQPLWFRSGEELVEAFPETRSFVADSQLSATACVPLIAWGRPLGFLAAHYRDVREFTEVDRVVFTTLASVSAQALERARRFELERETASALQQSMLPAGLPAVPGIEIAARYSSAGELEVGGDWYDAVALDDGTVMVTVGDVVGRGLAAATAMGQLRSAAGALSLTTARPQDVLASLDRFASTIDGARLATVAIARLDPVARTLDYASAGHVPGVLVQSNGTTELLEPERSLPLDALPEAHRDELRVDFPPGSTLVLYSDGLIERRGESLDIGLRRLTRTAASLSRVDIDGMCEHITSALLPKRQQRDDVAVLCVRLAQSRSSLRRRIPARPAELAPLRRELSAWFTDAGLAPERAADLVLAVDEACANAVEHAYDQPGSGDVVVELACEPDREVTVRVQDAGRWRDLPTRAHRGRGLAIIRAAVDDYDIRTGAGGTVVLLRQRLNGS
jgi:PAS domain S-box-containing protein